MKKGFTLIELLIVVIIIGILATMAIPQYSNLVSRAKRVEAITMLSSIGTASLMYYIQSGMPYNNSTIGTQNLFVTVPSNSNWSYVNTSNTTSTTASTFNWLASNNNTTNAGGIWVVGVKVDMPDRIMTFYEKKNNNSSSEANFQTTDVIVP